MTLHKSRRQILDERERELPAGGAASMIVLDHSRATRRDSALKRAPTERMGVLLPSLPTLNLADDVVSSVIGTLMAIVFISLLGGKIASFWSDRRFNRKWKTYRKIAADEIDEIVKRFYLQELRYLAGALKGIAEKPETDISHIDFDIFNLHREKIMRGLRFADTIFESYHFCLRETDVRRGQHFVVAAKRHLKYLKDELHSPIENFGGMLSSHLQGRYSLNEELRPLNCTRHQFMLACAIAIEDILKTPLNGDVLNRLSIFTNGLRKPGSAKPDSRELGWLALPLPALPEVSTAVAPANATE